MGVKHWWDKPAPTLRWKWSASVHLKHDVLPDSPPLPPADWPIPRVGDKIASAGTEEYEVVEVVWDYFSPKVEVYLK